MFGAEGQRGGWGQGVKDVDKKLKPMPFQNELSFKDKTQAVLQPMIR